MSKMSYPTLSSVQLELLREYRKAARRVHARVRPYAQHKFQARILRRGFPDEADLIPENDFIALLVAFRLIWAQKEPTNFGRIANLLYPLCMPDDIEYIEIIRRDWKEIPRRPIALDLFGEHFRPGDVLEAWMNGEVFHQGVDLRRRVELLGELGAMSHLILQLTVRDLCFCVVNLDNLAAHALQENALEPLVDIGSLTGSQ